MKTRLNKVAITTGYVVLFGFLAFRVLGSPVRYEIPGGFKGRLRIQWSDSNCPPLHRAGLFFVLTFPTSGQFCTSSSPPADLAYLKFEYLYPNGVRQSLRRNDRGKPGTQVWGAGYDATDKSDQFFVGDEHEDWNLYPHPTKQESKTH
jgi:hypothetical protein